MSFRYRCVLLGTLLTLAAGAAPDGALATGTTCPGPGSTSWTNPAGGDWNVPTNWSNGVPGSGCDAVITLPGTYTVFATGGGPLSVTLGGAPGSGTQTLQILGTTSAGSPQDALFNVGGGNLTIHPSGVLELTGSGSNTGGSTITGSGTIINSGLVETDLGVPGGTTNRDIQNGVTNNPGGTVALNADTNTCGCGGTHHWTNDGTIITAPGTTSTFTGTAQGVLFTQTTGSFINQGRALISGGFTNAGGTTSGNPIEFCGTSLDAHGSGASSFEFDPLPELNCGSGGVGGYLTGDIGPNTTVLVHNTTSAATVSLTLNPSITNHGTLTFDGGPGQDQLVGSGSTPFTNAGTLNLNADSAAPSTHFVSHVTNTGTINLASGSHADIAGPLIQAGGAVNLGSASSFSTNSTTVSGGTLTANGTFDPGGTLPVTGGVLQGTGTVAESVDNSGGTVHPGNSPGILSITGRLHPGRGRDARGRGGRERPRDGILTTRPHRDRHAGRRPDRHHVESPDGHVPRADGGQRDGHVFPDRLHGRVVHGLLRPDRGQSDRHRPAARARARARPGLSAGEHQRADCEWFTERQSCAQRLDGLVGRRPHELQLPVGAVQCERRGVRGHTGSFLGHLCGGCG